MVDLREVIDDETIEFDEPSRKMRTGRRVPMQTVAPLDLWVDPVSGSDTNTGLTQSDPLLTLEKMESLIPLWCLHQVTVHLKAENYALPTRGYFLRSRVTVLPIRIFADEDWDSDVYTQIATGVADAGTGQLVVTVVGGGLAVDVWRNEVIEFTDGAAAGWRQDVRDNTADSVVPSAGWDMGKSVAVPADGDSFRIFTADGCTLEAPAGGVAAGVYELAQPMLGGSVGDQDNNAGGVVFEGMRLASVDAVASWDQLGVSGFVHMFGVTTTGTLATVPMVVSAPGELRLGHMGSLIDATAPTPYVRYAGWGLRCEVRTCNPLAGARCDGFLNMEDLNGDIELSEGSWWRVRGGRVGRVFDSPDFATVLFEASGPLILSTPDPSVFYQSRNYSVMKTLGLEARGIGGAFKFFGMGTRAKLGGAGFTLVSHATPGQPVVDVSGGAEVIVLASPEGIGESTPGVPVSDWLLDGVAIDAVALLLADGDSIAGVDGSMIRRQF